jgi:hypothetical protein
MLAKELTWVQAHTFQKILATALVVRKGSAFEDTNPMKGNPVFDQVAVGVGEKIEQAASL